MNNEFVQAASELCEYVWIVDIKTIETALQSFNITEHKRLGNVIQATET